MNRFLKTFSLLVVGLLLLVSGVDATLDQLASRPNQAHFFLMSEQGRILYSYNGRLAPCDNPFYTAPASPRPLLTPRA